jgi:hypothetical protein
VRLICLKHSSASPLILEIVVSQNKSCEVVSTNVCALLIEVNGVSQYEKPRRKDVASLKYILLTGLEVEWSTNITIWCIVWVSRNQFKNGNVGSNHDIIPSLE